MSGQSSKWLKGCGIGCGLAVLLVILGTVGGGLVMMRPFREAIETREVLDERFGDQSVYTPAPDGSVAPERMEAFLSVRSALLGVCVAFRAKQGALDEMEQFDEVENPPKKELFRALFRATKGVMGMGPLMGKFFRLRNESLLAAEMGLGEYTYIYVLAYTEMLQGESGSEGGLFSSDRLSGRIRGVLAGFLRRQLEALRAEPDADSRGDEIEALAAEIRAFEEDRDAVPWQDGLPPAIASSFAPYRERLDELFCENTVDLELTRNRQRGIGIQGD